MNPQYGISHETLTRPSTILSIRKIHNSYFCTSKLWIRFKRKIFATASKNSLVYRQLKKIKQKENKQTRKTKKIQNWWLCLTCPRVSLALQFDDFVPRDRSAAKGPLLLLLKCTHSSNIRLGDIGWHTSHEQRECLV